MADALLVTSSFLPGHGGIESYLAELCERLAPRLAVLAPATRDGKPLPDDLAYPTEGGPGHMLWPGRKAAATIARTARAHGTDRVIFGTPWPLALLGPRLRKEGLRYSVIVHGAELTVPAAIPALRTKVATALAAADLLLPVSRYTAEKVVSSVGRARLPMPPLTLLRARVDGDRFRPDLDTAGVREGLGVTDETLLLCFGRLVPRKGVDRAIAIAHRLARKGARIVLVVAGTGPEEKRLRKLASKGPGRVVFAGRVTEQEAPALYAAADIFLLAVADRWFGLDIEGLGVVLCEAGACATPCITGRSGGTPEAVLHEETGLVVDGSDLDQLEAAVARLMGDPEERERMGALGRAYVQKEFGGDIPVELEDWMS